MYAIIDTETTGLSLRDDRIIEVALIGVDVSGNKQWEWCSLINPQRNTGHGLALRVHQIHSRDVTKAPTFADVAGHVAELLRERVLIAHNARFDLGMLGAEYRRLGVELPELVHICTAQTARSLGFRPWRLEACCAELGIELEGAHHALSDARATLLLAQRILNFGHLDQNMRVQNPLSTVNPWPQLPVVTRQALTRPILPRRDSSACTSEKSARFEKPSKPTRQKNVAPVPQKLKLDNDEPKARYLAAIEWVLEDRNVSQEQAQLMAALKGELGLTCEEVREIHLDFIRGLAGSMWSDGVISKHEKYDLEVCAKALELTDEEIEFALQHPLELGLVNEDYRLVPGARVVFTGEMSIPRSQWLARAKEAGLRVIGSVSRKTDFLVVPFQETGSNKAHKARELGVRILSEQRFIRMIANLESAKCSYTDG